MARSTFKRNLWGLVRGATQVGAPQRTKFDWAGDRTCDQLYAPPATQSHQSDWQLAIALAQSFQSFHRTCRIFGEPIAQSHARLALIWMTQILLKALLEERLGVFAPPEL
ncbi:MAG: hypothetical protein HC780_02685 [Leptolyngbyaceae cyanobacterium CSU_1_3]|nr:hypothetical protein [Leptolyngbyaceae cyanobacterium CSU_1_3]